MRPSLRRSPLASPCLGIGGADTPIIYRYEDSDVEDDGGDISEEEDDEDDYEDVEEEPEEGVCRLYFCRV